MDMNRKVSKNIPLKVYIFREEGLGNTIIIASKESFDVLSEKYNIYPISSVKSIPIKVKGPIGNSLHMVIYKNSDGIKYFKIYSKERSAERYIEKFKDCDLSIKWIPIFK